jgi:outer membrane receptor protein involved in Fe transport
MNGYEKSAAQLALRFDPGTFGRIDLVYYYGYADNDPAARVVPGGAFQMNCVRGTASPALGLPPPAITAFTDFCGVYPDGDDLPAPQRPRERATFDQTGNSTSVHHFNLRGDFDLWGGTLSTAVGYTKSKVEVFRSFDNRRDGLPFFLIPGGVTTTALANTFQGQANQNDETSLEIRWRSDQTKPVRWMVGAFLWRWDSDRPTLFGIDTTNFPAGTSPRLPVAGFRSFLTSDGRPSPFPTGGINVFYTEDRAYFGSLEWDITDQLTASIEVRNSRETKFRDLLLNPNTQTDTDGPGFKGSWDKTDPRFTLQYRWSDTLQFYASAAQGSKSGGFNTAATLASDVPFNPESNWTYELGAKGNLFDGALSFDAAIFSIDWSDVQLQAPPTPPSLTPITRNFGEVEARGAELALAWRAADWATFNLGVGYTDPKFTGRGSVDLAANTITFCLTDPRCSGDIIQITPPGGTPRNALSLDGNQLPRSSQWTVSAGADLERALTPVWTGYARGNYRFESEQFMAPNNFARIGDRHLLALRVGAFSDTFDVALWGENLTDDSTPLITGFATLLNTALTEQQVVLSTPRTWGVTASWKF